MLFVVPGGLDLLIFSGRADPRMLLLDPPGLDGGVGGLLTMPSLPLFLERGKRAVVGLIKRSCFPSHGASDVNGDGGVSAPHL